jgi:transcriptional regulator with XRE-family HTH domain
MTDPDWYIRLSAAIDAKVEASDPSKRKSKSAISVEAGLAKNFVSQLLTDKKAPSIDNFIALCNALDVSPTYILTGAPVTKEMEAVIAALAVLPEYKVQAVLDLVGGMPTSESQQ